MSKKLLISELDPYFENHEGSLRERLKDGLDPNSVNKDGVPILHRAIGKFNLEAVEILLRAGADPNKISPITTKFEFLSNSKTLNFGREAEFSGITPLVAVLNEGDIGSDRRNKTSNGRYKIASLLLEYGADVNKQTSKYGITPLHLAANYSHPNIVRKLIEYGADVNKEAFKVGKEIPYDEKSRVTPMLIAVNSKYPEEASECIKVILKNKGDIFRNTSLPNDILGIIDTLSKKYPKEATNILTSVLLNNNVRMERDRVEKITDDFLNVKVGSHTKIDLFLKKLLGEAISRDTMLSSGKYLGHLESWNGLLGYKWKDEYSFDACFSWKVFYQSPRKIKNIALVLDYINDMDNEDVIKQFDENKGEILNKLKSEIYNQVTNYFTSTNMFYLNRAFINRVTKEERHLQLRGNPGIVSKSDLFFRNEALAWCDSISKLKRGQSFSIAAGSSNHAIYVEFKRQDNGDFSRTIYNLGVDRDSHSVSLDNRYYPEIVRDIPKDVFENRMEGAVSYLKDVIRAKSMIWADVTKNLIYDKSNLGGEYAKKYDDAVAMKQQVTGNCSVKNNLAGMKNRFKNEKLYKFIKQFEVNKLKASIVVPNEVERAKEMQRDLWALKFMTEDRMEYPLYLEKQLYKFLSKRASVKHDQIHNEAGFRLADVLKYANKEKLRYYICNAPSFIGALEKVEEHYKTGVLTKQIKKYKTIFERQNIKKDELREDLNSREYLLFNKMSKSPVMLEEMMYRFLCKRGKSKSGDDAKEGDRILDAINNLQKGVMDFYVSSDSMMIKYLNCIAKTYNVKGISKIVDDYSKKYIIVPRDTNRKIKQRECQMKIGI